MAPMAAPRVALFDQDAPDIVPERPPETGPMPVERSSLSGAVTVQRVRLWSVARVAGIFWCCVGVLWIGVFLGLWTVLTSTGTVSNFESFVTDVTGVKQFHLMSGPVLSSLAILVLLGTVVAIVLTVAAAAFFNAVTALTGGLTVDCEEPLRRRRPVREGKFSA